MEAEPQIQEEPPLQAPLIMLLILFFTAMIGSALGTLLSAGLVHLVGADMLTLINGASEESSMGDRYLLRAINLIGNLMTFAVPTLAMAYFSTRQKWANFLGLDKWAKPSTFGFGILFILAGFPLAQATYWINKQLPSPEWAQRMEEAANGMLESVLTMNDPAELLFTLLVVGVVPAIGEELLFRGAIQKNLERITNRSHLAIWCTGIIFSAIHMQFEGFIPRALLGAALGYLYYWTSNLWVPILAHFFFNGSQVVAQYLTAGSEQALNLEEVESPHWWITLGGLVIMAYSAYRIKGLSSSKEHETRQV